MAMGPNVLVSVDFLIELSTEFFVVGPFQIPLDCITGNLVFLFSPVGCPVNHCENGGTCIISEIGNICK